MGYRKVLVPVSGKYRLERSGRALEQALQIVREDGEICFFHCVDEVPYLIAGEAHKKLVLEDASAAEQLLTPLAERARNAGIAYSVHIVEGSPVTRIPKFVEENKCDVVVMFAGGHNDLGAIVRTLVMGSITERILHVIDVPLLVVH